MALGGSIRRLSVKGRNFSVVGDADANMVLGGFTNTITANGDGTTQISQKRVPGALTDVEISLDNVRGDLEFLQDLANNGEVFPLYVEYSDGTAYSARVQIEGDLSRSSMDAKATVGFKGEKFVKQS